MGRSASRKLRYASAPPAVSVSESVATTSTSARLGSDASYAANSEARSEGSPGAWGAMGAENVLTSPTWASLVCSGCQAGKIRSEEMDARLVWA